MKQNLMRNEESVSAAIATVLLFGGVVSIIGLMLVSMIPIIEELEGSIERDDMSAQMMILSQQTETLSEHGMPGDSTEVELIPLDGNLRWDYTRAGMWYSSTWNEETSFRMKGVLDFNDNIEVKNPSSKTTAVCFDDLRLGPTRPFIYTIPEWSEKLMINSNQGLATPLGPIEIKVYSGQDLIEEISLEIDNVATISTTSASNYRIESSHEISILSSSGSGGTSMITPDNTRKSDLTGRSWTIPVDVGTATIHVMSKNSNLITLTVGDQEFTHMTASNIDHRIGTSWTHNLSILEPELITITTSSPSRLMFISNNLSSVGSTTLQSSTGSFIGNEFITPELTGNIELYNPNDEITIITWKNGGVSVPAYSTAIVSWPPAGISGAPIIDADKEIITYWHNNDSSSIGKGISVIPALDTGFSSGFEHAVNSFSQPNEGALLVQLAGYQSNWSHTDDVSTNYTSNYTSPNQYISVEHGLNSISVEEGHPVRVYRKSSDSGLIELMHDGEQRCIPLNIVASGWINTNLPWRSISGQSDSEIIDSWNKGTHPASYSINLIGSSGESEHTILSSAWVFHISRLTYGFASSITGMEVAYTCGAVVTNHPEFLPTILKQPNDRSGPGPRFAATIPALNPTSDSSSGAGKMTLDIEMAYRESLASETSYEVRRGWHSPYGEAIANSAASGLDSSIDWTIYPGRLDLLTDYVGWVPDPSIGTSEAVWHTNGNPIQFSLQLSSLDVTMEEVIG